MSQVTPVLPVVGVYSGLTAAGYINSGFATLNTCWLGSSAPSDAPNGIPASGQFWIDTSAAGYQLIKKYDGTSWVLEAAIQTTDHILLNPIGGGTVSIASAATTDLGSKNEAYQTITGTTSITSFGSNVPKGQVKLLTFGGILTLTYNGTSLILPGAANIATAAGDVAIMVSLGSGNWKCLFYGRISGAQLSMTGTAGTVASASTTDLASAGANAVIVSGTTTITSFGSNATLANPYYLVRFTGALILTYNAASLIIPGAQNVTTTAGDWCICEYLGSGNWRVNDYMTANGQPISMSGPDTTIASAGTTSLTTVSNCWNITGTTTITALGSAASVADPVFFVRFTGALTLTHNGTSLILPGSANITTAAGDAAIFLYLGSGNWRCLDYQKADGTAVVATGVIPYALINGLIPTSMTFTNSTTASCTITAGQATDSTNAKMLAGGSFSWNITNGNAANGYQGGTTLPNSSAIHFYIITNSSNASPASFASTSLTPTLPTGYTSGFYRRIFTLFTNASGVLLGSVGSGGVANEIGGGAMLFYVTTQILDCSNSAPGTASRTLFTLSVPTGIKVQPLARSTPVASASNGHILTSPDETDVAAATPTQSNWYSYFTAAPGYDSGVNSSGSAIARDGVLTTNTSGQIGVRAAGTSVGNFYLVTRGWIDFRRS